MEFNSAGSEAGAGLLTCGDRIFFEINDKGLGPAEACNKVAREFPGFSRCGGCVQSCSGQPGEPSGCNTLGSCASCLLSSQQPPHDSRVYSGFMEKPYSVYCRINYPKLPSGVDPLFFGRVHGCVAAAQSQKTPHPVCGLRPSSPGCGVSQQSRRRLIDLEHLRSTWSAVSNLTSRAGGL